jgi:hypothetical protein
MLALLHLNNGNQCQKVGVNDQPLAKTALYTLSQSDYLWYISSYAHRFTKIILIFDNQKSANGRRECNLEARTRTIGVETGLLRL